jgi:hypothetical protein
MSEEGFYTNSISIIYNPSKFVLDFKQITPRIEKIQGKEQQIFTTNHKIILIDPQFAKVFLETLKTSIENYEKKFGKIGMPKKKKKPEVVVSTNSYIG